MSYASVVLLGLAAAGCTDGGAGEDGPDGPPSGEPAIDPVTSDGVPTSPAALQTYLIAGDYRTWAAERAPHTSAGPHGRVRTFVSPGLAASLAGGGAHPKGATAIKELYRGETVSGWAVEIKIADDSKGGRGWYWYEVFSAEPGATPAVSGTGVAGCTNCHGAGNDYVRVPFPLQ